MRRLREFEWEAVAGIIAAVIALVLHLLHVVETDVLLAVALVILALLMVRDLRRQGREERLAAVASRTAELVERLEARLAPPDAVLIGPRRLREYSERFAREAQGEMVWFNVCLLMFRPQGLFDSLLRPAIENPRVERIRFVLDEGERQRWEQDVMPKVAVCRGAEKVLEPQWAAMHEAVSFVLADRREDGRPEAQLSFWGEPFMSRTAGGDVPRYIFHVQAHSELIGRLVEMERSYRLRS
jgi:hypothetical protein